MILVLNLGSQSIRWKLFGEKLKPLKKNKVDVFNLDDFEKILEEELLKLKDEKISLIGHRVVHGGGKFLEPLKITSENLTELEKINHLAPLHNPFNILGIKACQKIFTEAENAAVFDTEFFKDLPEKALLYALPEKLTKEYGFRKFGFHGISHEYSAKEAAKKIRKPFDKLRIIACHLGGGCSISAIKNGKAVDTSMGFTPMQGLVMMTRAGEIDSGIVLEIARKFASIEKADEILNSESGVKGICGYSDMRDVLGAVKKGDKKAKLALEIFVYSIQKYIGSYFAILGGCDLLVFTGAIGFGSSKIRNMVCGNLDILNPSARLRAGTKITAIEPDEELAIATKIMRYQ